MVSRAGALQPSYTGCVSVSAKSALRENTSALAAALKQGKRPHAEFAETGLQTDDELSIRTDGSHHEVIPGSSVYLKSYYRDVRAWTALILEQTRCGHSRRALRLYEDMQNDDVQPSPQTFFALLKACSSLRDLESAKKLHAEVVRHGFDSDLYVGTMVVDVYAKCRSLVHARQVFETMPRRDVVAWNAMILGYAQMEKGEEALQLFTRMQQEGLEPDDRTFVSVLKACSAMAECGENISPDGLDVKTRCVEVVRAIHADIKRSRFGECVFVKTMLVDAYVKCASLEAAREVFDNMLCRDVVSWNAMILGYAQMGKGKDALQLYILMQQEGVAPDSRTYVGVLKGCSSLVESGETGTEKKRVTEECLSTVIAVHGAVLKSKARSDVFVLTMLVDAYAKCGNLDGARHVFERMPRKDVVSWTAMILGYAQHDRGQEALLLYSRMRKEGVVPDNRTHVSALKACGSLAASFDSEESSEQYAKQRCLKTVRAIHATVMRGKLELDTYVGNMLVDVYAKCGSLGEARLVFEKMPNRTVVSWNAMILGYAQMDKGDEALQLYSRMQSESVVADARTYVSALKACSTLAAAALDGSEDCSRTAARVQCPETVKRIHGSIREGGFESDVFVGNMLVDVYAKCGSLEMARHVFESMPCRTVVSWTAMIFGYVRLEQGEVALDLYTRMQREGVEPNRRTYVCALIACGSTAGLAKGREIHAHILKGGSDAFDSFVGDSLIHMYSKCGSMLEAQRVFEAMPMKGVVAWNTLIAGYAHQGESGLAFDLFRRMKEERVRPDGLTFLGVLTACTQAGLVHQGQTYFKSMSTLHEISPTVHHFNCMIDLLGRAGHLEEAMELAKAMPVQPHSALWRCLLGACQKWGYVELGKQAFDCAVKLNKDDAAAYVLMSNIYAAAQMPEEAKQIQAMRVRAQARKQAGRSQWADPSGTAHNFVVGDRNHPESRGIYASLGCLLVKMKEDRCASDMNSGLPDTHDDHAEDTLPSFSPQTQFASPFALTPSSKTMVSASAAGK